MSIATRHSAAASSATIITSSPDQLDEPARACSEDKSSTHCISNRRERIRRARRNRPTQPTSWTTDQIDERHSDVQLAAHPTPRRKPTLRTRMFRQQVEHHRLHLRPGNDPRDSLALATCSSVASSRSGHPFRCCPRNSAPRRFHHASPRPVPAHQHERTRASSRPYSSQPNTNVFTSSTDGLGNRWLGGVDDPGSRRRFARPSLFSIVTPQRVATSCALMSAGGRSIAPRRDAPSGWSVSDQCRISSIENRFEEVLQQFPSFPPRSATTGRRDRPSGALESRPPTSSPARPSPPGRP
jgi:hypothetical protein